MTTPIQHCEWCSEPLDASGECPNEECEGNLPEDMDDDYEYEWESADEA